MERSEIILIESQRKLKDISMKWDTALNLEQNCIIGLASKIGHLKGVVSYWLSPDVLGNLRKETYEGFSRIENDLRRIENEIDYEYN